MQTRTITHQSSGLIKDYRAIIYRKAAEPAFGSQPTFIRRQTISFLKKQIDCAIMQMNNTTDMSADADITTQDRRQ